MARYRLATVSVLLAALLAIAFAGTAGAQARSSDPYDWLRPAARDLVRAGVLQPAAARTLHRDVTRGELDNALAALGGRPVPRGDSPRATVSVWATHLLVVRALGLEPERRALARLSTHDGVRLRLPRNFASEVLVRELGLVVNHPSDRDHLERARSQPMRMADLVHLLDRARGLSRWSLERMSRFRDPRLPAMTPARRAIAEVALAQVGQPYVWGGDWPTARSPWGAQARGGFDCSGLAWWTFKGAPGARSMGMESALLGRTADQMAFERPRQRMPVDRATAGDLVFFGPGGPRARRGTIAHMAISLGGGWIVHSAGSRGGVSMSHLDSYWPSATAFARSLPELS